MEGLPSKGCQPHLSISRETSGFGSKACAIEVITDQRVADRGQVHPDLVGTPGQEPADKQACRRLAVDSRIAFQDLPMSYGRAALRTHRHFVAGMGVAADRAVD